MKKLKTSQEQVSCDQISKWLPSLATKVHYERELIVVSSIVM